MSSKTNKRASISAPRRASISPLKKTESVSLWSLFKAFFFGIL